MAKSKTIKVIPGPPFAGHPGRGGSNPPKQGCCPMVEAGHALRRGKVRLARRYFAMSVRLLAARV